jgi:long-chain acyl-CoA synthetase
MTKDPLLLDHVYAHEQQLPHHVYLSQPFGPGVVKDYTWGQIMDASRRMAAHLLSLNFEPGSKIAILSKNTAHFIMAELAIWMAGHTTVAIFPTETARTIRYVLEHSEAKLLFVGKLDTWPQQMGGVPDELPRITLPLAPPNGHHTWDRVIAHTAPLTGQPARQADDMAMLMYTSGSTGRPKGVMISFGAISRTGEGTCAAVRREIGDIDVRVLSYLPLAHIFERAWIEAASLTEGTWRMYFAESIDTFVQDVQRARPTVFQSVPRLWLKFQQGVLTKVPAKKLNRLLGIPLLGKLVARKVLKGLGLDQVALAASGSAPISPELIQWYRRLGLKLLEGYAMTEDCAYSHMATSQFNAPGYVGVPLPGVEVRISDNGEVEIKSPGQFSGYYKQADLTAEVFTDDGFFRTGDLGERDSDGMLKLTGRAKELFKTAKGKYVAPAPLENLLNASPLVELSLVSGHGQAAAYALVMLAESIRPTLHDPAVRARIGQELEQLRQHVNHQVSDYEQLRMLVVVGQAWTIDNGALTPTLKIKRSQIEHRVAHELSHWYSQSDTVIWLHDKA